MPNRNFLAKFQEQISPVRPPSALEIILTRFSQDGIPPLASYAPHSLPEEAKTLLQAVLTNEGFIRLFPKRNDIPAIMVLQQSILQELVVTEAQYQEHLKVVVDVYIATAHGLQDKGFLLDIKAWMVFYHMPDIYNSAMKFWELVIYPMLRQATRSDGLLDPKLIIPGFLQFPKIFFLYENYMQDQTSGMEYYRNMLRDSDFAHYIKWCSTQSKDRLQLQDILIKPMQRLTKYSLIIDRLKAFVLDEDTLKKLNRVEDLIKSFVTKVNRAVRKTEEFVELNQMRIEPYEPEYKGDDQVEKLCKKYQTIDLNLPMIDCGTVGRCLIHQGMVRYKDAIKEFDAHVLLFSDMMIICKKLPKIKEKDKDKLKKEYTHWKMLRPKIMLTRLLPTSKKNPLVYVILDELGSIVSVFQLSEISKDSFGDTLKIWELKIFEAMVTYVLTKWYVKNPPGQLDEVVKRGSIADTNKKGDVEAAEKRAKERVAAMLYKKEEVKINQKYHEKYQEAVFQFRLLAEYAKNYRCIKFDPETVKHLSKIAKKTATERQANKAEAKTIPSQGVVSSGPRAPVRVMATEVPTDKSVQGHKHIPTYPNIREILYTGIGDYCKERLLPIQQLASRVNSMVRSVSETHISSSCGSHAELDTDNLHRPGSALERYGPPASFFEVGGHRSSAMKLHMIPKTNTQCLVLSTQAIMAPTLVFEESSPNNSPGPRSGSSCSDDTLRLDSDDTLMNSMPDIDSEIRRVLSMNLEPGLIPLTASERLYRSHQELMQKNRIAAGQRYLKPDFRGSSYPPPSPRALQRGDAVSFSFGKPPLTRAQNVPEQTSASQLQSTRRIFGRRSPQSDMATGSKSPRRQRSPSPIPRAVRPLGEKSENKKLFMRRSKKDSQYSQENDASNAAYDRSRGSSQEKGKHQRAESSIAEDAGNSTRDD